MRASPASRPDLSRGIAPCGDKVCITPEASNAIQKYIVDMETVEAGNRLRSEGYRRNAEFLIETMNNLLAGE